MNNKITEIIFLLDRSGSMAGLERDTIGGFNGFIERQNQLDGQTLLTTILFDDQYEVLWNGVPGEGVKLTEKDYFVRGSTALLDAVGKTIVNVANRINKFEQTHEVIFVITTDGMENSSREFTYPKVRDLIQKHKNWEFVFMGANLDVAKEAEEFGISVENAFDFDASEDGVQVMYDTVSEVVSNMRANRHKE